MFGFFGLLLMEWMIKLSLHAIKPITTPTNKPRPRPTNKPKQTPTNKPRPAPTNKPRPKPTQQTNKNKIKYKERKREK